MSAQRKDDFEQEETMEVATITSQANDEIGRQQNDQKQIVQFMSWSLQNLLPAHTALFAIIDMELKKAMLQSDIAIKQSIDASQTVKVAFKPKGTVAAANKGQKVPFKQAKENQPRVMFRPLPAPVLPVTDKLGRTKLTVKEARKNRVEFRYPTDVANINGPSPKTIVSKAEQTLRERQEQEAANSPHAPEDLKKKKKRPHGLSR